MPLETATHISGLVASNPASADGLNQADDHMRLIKSVLLNDVGNALTSKALTVVDGSSSAPSIGFAADATAGFYRKGAGQTAVVGRLTGQGTVPIGSLIDFAGPDATTPPGYFACDGTALSRTGFAELFAALGTTWGAGDGSTTFNIPNMVSRYRRHRDNSALSGPVGTIQADQNKTHTHTGSGTTGNQSADHQHPFSGTTGTDSPDHTHTSINGAGSNSGSGVTGGGSFTLPTASQTVTSAGANQRHQHSFSGTTGGITASHTHPFSFTTSGGSADGTETRPLSATVLTCIRAF